jgi:hypothetical protein
MVHIVYGSFTLERFVRKIAFDIAMQYCLPYLPWQLGSFLSLSLCPREAKASKSVLLLSVIVVGIIVLPSPM